jgi:hypothetical protein
VPAQQRQRIAYYDPHSLCPTCGFIAKPPQR